MNLSHTAYKIAMNILVRNSTKFCEQMSAYQLLKAYPVRGN
jgi:hypothetical protein